MKKLFAILFLAGWAHGANTYTTRTGILKPADLDTGWGTTLRSSFDIIDASMCIQGAANTFTGVNTFSNIYLSSSTFVYFKNSNGVTGPFIGNQMSLGLFGLTMAAADGIGLGTNNVFGNTPMVMVSTGGFAVYGSSADATSTYSGFKGTSPVSASTLWSLPLKDGASEQVLKTDGSGHLSFITVATGSFSDYVRVTSTLQSGATFYVSSGTVDGLFYVGKLRLESSSVQTQLNELAIQVSSVTNVAAVDSVAKFWNKNANNRYLALYPTTGASNRSPYMQLNDSVGNKYVNVKASNTITTLYDLVLPNAPGTTGQVVGISEVNGSTVSLGFTDYIPSGSTNYVRNTETLQSGATFYVSSGTVNSLTVTGNMNINLGGYRRPNLVWISTNAVDLEAQSTDGVTDKTCVIFQDGNKRCATETTSASVHAYRRFIGGQTASFGVAMNGGLNPGETITSTSAIAFYAVRSTATSNTTDFTIVGTTAAPVYSNYAALNTAFGVNGWVYLGTDFWGDNCSNMGFPKFVQSGQVSILYNRCNAVSGTPGVILSSSSSTSDLVWTYSSGMIGGVVSNNKMPPHFKIVQYSAMTDAMQQAGVTFIRDQTSGADILRHDTQATGGNAGTIVMAAWYPTGTTIEFFNSLARPLALFIRGWVDSALTGGGNPMF